MAMNDFYVYLHRKATTGEIFYVGKGTALRAFDKKARNRHWKHIARKHGFTVEIVESGLQEWAAFELESELIALYGRMDLGLGCLVNYTDGGDGASGVIVSYETRMKISRATRGIKKSEETKLKMSAWQIGRTFSDETKRKISSSLSGKKLPEEQKLKIQASTKLSAQRSANHYKSVEIKCVTTGKHYGSVADAIRWLVSIGFLKAAHANVLKACKGKFTHAYGFVWEYA